MEWARFRKYARRMRKIECSALGVPPSEAFSVLQFRAMKKPFFPNLDTLRLWSPAREFIPSIPLFLSPRTTTIKITFNELKSNPKAVVASMITTLPILSLNLRHIALYHLPRDPMITAAVSEMLLASNRNTLRFFRVDSPLTEEARDVIFKLPDLCDISMVIERDAPLPSVVLPNLTNLTIKCDHAGDLLRVFHGATFGKLASVTFCSKSEPTGNFLEALATSTSATLSTFTFHTSRPWRPGYRSLLPFTRLSRIDIDISCEGGCLSTIDDDIITDIAQSMPGLKNLHLGMPCQTPTGVTVKGLAALAYYCLDLSTLRIHFRVASLNPPAIPIVTSRGEPTIPREDCALTDLYVGKIPMPEESVLMVTLTLLRIFPRIDYIVYSDQRWGKVEDAITHSKHLVDHSSKYTPLVSPRSKVDDASPRSNIWEHHMIRKSSEVPEEL